MALNPSVATGVDADNVRLAAESYTSFREIAQILRITEKDTRTKFFYADLTAYYLMIRNHINHISQTSPRFNNELIKQALSLLVSTLAPSGSDVKAPTCTKLNEFLGHWDDVRRTDNIVMKLHLIRNCLDFGKTDEERSDYLLSIRACAMDLETQHPEETSSRMAQAFTTSKKITEPSYGVWQAAQSMFNALASSTDCLCNPSHEFGARLRLGTYRRPPNAECDIHADAEHDFEMFLSLKQEWHEARVRLAKEQVVQFDDGTPQSKISKRLKPQSLKVKSLCEPLTKIKTLKAYRLELKVMRKRLFRMKSEKSELIIDGARDPISLESFLRSSSRSLTSVKTKQILAVILSSAVLHLHDTPWLKPTWRSSDILFFRTASSQIPLQPFLQTDLSGLGLYLQSAAEGSEDCDDITSSPASYGADPDDINSDDMDLDDLDGMMPHHCPTLVALAIILMEVYLVAPFDVLVQRFGVMLEEDEQQANHTRHINANVLFQACRDEIPEDTRFYQAVERCLDPTIWEDEDGNKLDSVTMRTRIYEEVVQPLEIELTQGFSSISIDDLDRLAQSLDFGSWDQHIQDVGQQAAANASTYDDANRWGQNPPPGASFCVKPPDLSESGFSLTNAAPSDWNHQAQGNNLVLSALPPTTQIAGNHQSFKFFDDETIPNASAGKACAQYKRWKADYAEVYEHFIPNEQTIAPIRVAVLDTGIDMTHPDVEARVESIKTRYNWHNEKQKSKVHDRNGHGTFTACLILDFAPDAELYIAKIAEKDPSNPTVIAKAINLAVDEWKVDVISMSFGFPDRNVDGYNDLENALRNAYVNNVVLFAAASNDGGRAGLSFPARAPTVIAVHATDTDGNRSKFSPTATSFGVALATVGEAVESAWPVVLCDDDSNCVRYKSGTSYATPIMAGMAAFLMMYASIHLPEQAHALRKQDAIKALLRRLAEKGSGYRPRDEYHFVDISLRPDNLFGKGQDFIDETIKDVLRST